MDVHCPRSVDEAIGPTVRLCIVSPANDCQMLCITEGIGGGVPGIEGDGTMWRYQQSSDNDIHTVTHGTGGRPTYVGRVYLSSSRPQASLRAAGDDTSHILGPVQSWEHTREDETHLGMTGGAWKIPTPVLSENQVSPTGMR